MVSNIRECNLVRDVSECLFNIFNIGWITMFITISWAMHCCTTLFWWECKCDSPRKLFALCVLIVLMSSYCTQQCHKYDTLSQWKQRMSQSWQTNNYMTLNPLEFFFITGWVSITSKLFGLFCPMDKKVRQSLRVLLLDKRSVIQGTQLPYYM